jgi:hypothetical protein
MLDKYEKLGEPGAFFKAGVTCFLTKNYLVESE